MIFAALAALPGFGGAYAAVAKAVGFILRCTPCMIALAIGVAWIVGNHHGHKKEAAAWSAKWDAAEAQAERDRLKRDALAKLKIEVEANAKIATIDARAAQLEGKVQQYEQEEELRRAAGAVAGARKITGCLTDQSDDQWLLDIRRGTNVKPKARRGLAERLRAGIKGSPDPGKR